MAAEPLGPFIHRMSMYNDAELQKNDKELANNLTQRLQEQLEPLSNESRKELKSLKERVTNLSKSSSTPSELQGALNQLDKVAKVAFPPLKMEVEAVDPQAKTVRPKKSNAMDPAMRDVWIEAHPPEMRKAVKELSEKVIHVSQEEFEKNLNKTMISFQKEIETIPDFGKQSVVSVHKRKSNLWVYQLASESGVLKKELPQDSNRIFHWPSDPTEEVEQKLSEYKPQYVVLFDDAIYSGEQMSEKITEVFKLFDNLKIARPKVYLIAPYMTDIGKKNIEKSVKKMVDKNTPLSDVLFISEHEKIPTVSETLSKKSTKVLETSYWSHERTHVHAEEFVQKAQTRGMIYFDHKVGDYLSFPEPLAQGWVVDHEGNRLYDSDAPSSPIPDTTPPYKPWEKSWGF